MGVEVTLNNISSGYNRTKINQNFTNIETSLEDALSRTGNAAGGSNAMQVDIDMNGNGLLNVGAINLGGSVFVDAGDLALKFLFESTTTMADPGAGDVRFNNATLSSVTAIAIADTDSSAQDRSAYIVTWDDSTNTNKGELVVTDTTSGAWAIFTVTGLTDNAGWSQLAVTHVASNGTFSDNDAIFLTFYRAGDAGVGDVVGPASATDNAFVRFDSTTGKLIQNGQTTEDDSGNVTIAGTLNGITIANILDSGDIGLIVQGFDADTLKADVSDTLTAGMLTTSHNLGNLSTATTLSIANGNIQHGTMTGSFTLTAPNDTDDGYCEVELTIDATGGYTLTLSGFNELSGTFDSTANKVNLLRVSKLNTNTYLEITQAV